MSLWYKVGDASPEDSNDWFEPSFPTLRVVWNGILKHLKHTDGPQPVVGRILIPLIGVITRHFLGAHVPPIIRIGSKRPSCAASCRNRQPIGSTEFGATRNEKPPNSYTVYYGAFFGGILFCSEEFWQETSCYIQSWVNGKWLLISY